MGLLQEFTARSIILKGFNDISKIESDQSKTADDVIKAYDTLVSNVMKVVSDQAQAEAMINAELKKIQDANEAEQARNNKLVEDVMSGKVNLKDMADSIVEAKSATR